MILFDTSAIYALADTADPNNARATSLLQRLLQDHELLLLHSYVLAEAASLLQRRVGLSAALRFLRESELFPVHWVAETEHRQAVELLEQQGRRDLSLVDCVSFAVMRLHAIDTAFTFDADFERAGFRVYGATG